DASKKQALQLLAQARGLQKDSRLVEARQKVVECLQMGATFSPNEEGPDQVMLQLGLQARQQINGCMQQANELVASAAANPGNYDRAEQVLFQAQQLANGFGLDPQPVESKLAWARQNHEQALAAAQPNLRNPLEPPPPQPIQQVQAPMPAGVPGDEA